FILAGVQASQGGGAAADAGADDTGCGGVDGVQLAHAGAVVDADVLTAQAGNLLGGSGQGGADIRRGTGQQAQVAGVDQAFAQRIERKQLAGIQLAVSQGDSLAGQAGDLRRRCI